MGLARILPNVWSGTARCGVGHGWGACVRCFNAAASRTDTGKTEGSKSYNVDVGGGAARGGEMHGASARAGECRVRGGAASRAAVLTLPRVARVWGPRRRYRSAATTTAAMSASAAVSVSQG